MAAAPDFIARAAQPLTTAAATLKICTPDGARRDLWLAHTMQNGTGNNRTLLHGIFTYDQFWILKAMRTTAGQWTHLAIGRQ